MAILSAFACENISEPKIEIEFKNGDFEQGIFFPDYWEISPVGVKWFEYSYDYDHAYSGERSIKLTIPDYSQATFSMAGLFQLIFDFPASNELSFTVFIKTESIDTGTVRFAATLLDKNGHCLKNSFNQDNITGTRDWEKLEIISEIPGETRAIYFYLMLEGQGTVWFDKARVDFK